MIGVYTHIGDFDVNEVTTLIEQIFGAAKNEGPKPTIPVPLPGPPAEKLSIFQHDLLYQFALTINYLLPLLPQRHLSDIRNDMMICVIGNNIYTHIYIHTLLLLLLYCELYNIVVVNNILM